VGCGRAVEKQRAIAGLAAAGLSWDDSTAAITAPTKGGTTQSLAAIQERYVPFSRDHSI